MGYVTENLMPGEKVIHQAKLHWIIFVTPALLLVLGLLMLGGGQEAASAAEFFIVIALLLGVGRAITYSTSEFAVTDRRVLIKVGLIRRRSLELNLAKVEGVGIDQSILGRLLNYGTVVVTGTGGTKEPFKNLAGPMAFRHAVQNQGAGAQARV